MFVAIKEALSVCLSVFSFDHAASNIYEVSADQTKYIMGK